MLRQSSMSLLRLAASTPTEPETKPSYDDNLTSETSRILKLPKPTHLGNWKIKIRLLENTHKLSLSFSELTPRISHHPVRDLRCRSADALPWCEQGESSPI